MIFFTDKNTFINAEGAKINYSPTRITDEEIHIIPEGLLSQKDVTPQPAIEQIIAEVIHNNKNDDSKNHFDIFAASFYLLSRYEEYLPFEVDAHDRFSAKQSLAYRLDFLQKPILHTWSEALYQKLFPNETLVIERKYNFLPTYDIDAAFAYKNKGFLRTFGALLSDFFNRHRWQVLLGSSKDPFDTFAFLDALHQRLDLSPIYFFLLADWAKYDKNISIQNTYFQDIIKNILKKYDTGIHPSYCSNDDFFILEKEINRLAFFKEKAVTKSRQHFLKLRFPTTYQRLIAAGIEEDFSMGYADAIGFRASVAIPFFWYDLENEQVTSLRLHSFQAMDVTLKEYLRLTPTESITAVTNLIEVTAEAKGVFTTLWHNSSFDKHWEGWQTAYETIVEKARL